MSKAEIVHFTVEGEFITSTARSLWNEEKQPERALAIIECVQGLTRDQQFDVLEGRSKLVGDSSKGITLEPDAYSGKTLGQVLKEMRQEKEEVQEDLADLVQVAIGDTVVVGSPTGARRVPLRRTTRSSVTGRQMLDEDVEFDDLFDDAERNEMRAVHKKPKPTKRLRMYKRDDDYGKSWSRTKDTKKNEEAAVAARKKAEREAEDELEKERERKWEESRARAKARVEADAQDRITGDTGWLSPEGKFYPCGYSQHAWVQWALGNTDNPQNHFVEMAGWVRLSVSSYGKGPVQNFFGEQSLFTDIQKKLVKERCEELKVDLPYWLEK